MNAALLRTQIEEKLPSAFAAYMRMESGSIPTGIAQIDEVVQGVPLHGLTEICGSNLASSGKTSVLMSLLAKASPDHFCALVDAGDSFDPGSGQAAGIHLSRLLWVRCGKSRVKLPPLEQAFKVTDILLQSSGFGLIAVDLSSIPERVVRKVPLSSWFRFSRVIEKQSAALVFIGQESHATSCAGLVVRVSTEPAVFMGNLFTRFNLKIAVERGREKKPVGSEKVGFSLQTQWA
jgi:recombination protein RecA